MELTEENIKKLKSLVRVSMDMHDKDNWENGKYFGDARKFWDGAMSGIDLWVDKMRESQNASTSDEALPIGDVVGQSEQFICGAERVHGEERCDKQCGICLEEYGTSK
jgi:hypothetical protein